MTDKMTENDVTPFDCSHALRLSAVDWVVVGVAMLVIVGLAPMAWERYERFKPGGDYRLPYEISSDYWLYGRHCREVCRPEKGARGGRLGRLGPLRPAE